MIQTTMNCDENNCSNTYPILDGFNTSSSGWMEWKYVGAAWSYTFCSNACLAIFVAALLEKDIAKNDELNRPLNNLVTKQFSRYRNPKETK